MADTLQIVRWALERKCDFRGGENYFLPEKTNEQIGDIRTVAKACADSRVVGDTCVTSWTMGDDKSGNFHDIPHSGFRISQRLEKFGGWEQIKKTCQACEANVRKKNATRAAGCFGYVDVWPDSEDLDRQLWSIIEKRDLETRLRKAFVVTNPLWYGFWIKSPLRRQQCELLHEILDAACDYDSDRDDGSVNFINALRIAMDWELPLHVSLAPLGHTDFGWYTIFPHCPRCKANAPVGRWKDNFASEDFECEVCGNLFNPNEHHSSKRMDDKWDDTSFEKQLGKAEHEKITRAFLAHRGCSESQIEEVIDIENNGPLLRQVSKVRRQRRAQIRQLREKNNSTKTPRSDLPKNFKVDLDGVVEMEFVRVPAGAFRMGSPEEGENSNEAPQHSVNFESPFFMGRFPVTQSQWNSIMVDSPFREIGPDLPVDQVSWFDCQDFCKKLSKIHQRVFRLPSEAEWEYACRAGTTTQFAFGDTLSVEQANFTPMEAMLEEYPSCEQDATDIFGKLKDAEPKQTAKPTPIGSYPPNDWGIYDMHGNVEEWCEDVWHENYEGAPSDGSAWLVGEEHEHCRVVRGGRCTATEFACASASRRKMGANAGSRTESEIDAAKTGQDCVKDQIFEMIYFPFGFRVVCEA